VRVVAPDFVLQLPGEHRQLVAVGAQQAHGPGGAGAGAGQGGNAFGELRQADFQAAIGLGQEGLVQADAFEQGNVFGGHGTLALGLVGAGGDGRQQGLEVFEQGVWLFHGLAHCYWTLASAAW
jgi:hypothetical protein